MVFRVEMDGESIACSSARCVSRLLKQGWTLSDPAQRRALEELLAAEAEPEYAAPLSLHAAAAAR